MGHISFWLMLMMRISWEITYILCRKTQKLIDSSKEVCLKVNKVYKYVAVSSPEFRSKCGLKIAHRSFENVSQSIYLGTTILFRGN
jgi:hypothetical protein